jgi:CIC family chloride channel protein
LPLFLGGVGLATGYAFTRLIPESLGAGTDGTDAMIKAFHRQSGIIRPRVFFLRAAGAILTMAAGGSAGSEGPMSQLGGGMGSYLAMKLGLSARERRILLLAGAAGGLGAIFRAPLGGALTAVEVVYREDFEAEAVLPAVVSSVTAYTIMTLFFGTGSIFTARPIISAASWNCRPTPFWASFAPGRPSCTCGPFFSSSTGCSSASRRKSG